MKKTMILTTLAGVGTLAAFVAVVNAADQSTRHSQPPAGSLAPHGSATNPTGEGRPEPRELPRIIMVAAVSPKLKDDPEIQKLVDKAITDLQSLNQDEAARLAAFQQLVQAERGGDSEAGKTARNALSDASQKVTADFRQVNQDRELLYARIKALIPQGEAGPGSGPGLQPRHSQTTTHSTPQGK